jgi:hypothetical protein
MIYGLYHPPPSHRRSDTVTLSICLRQQAATGWTLGRKQQHHLQKPYGHARLSSGTVLWAALRCLGLLLALEQWRQQWGRRQQQAALQLWEVRLLLKIQHGP